LPFSGPRVVVAGLRGGSGKTTLSLGMIAAWREKGLFIVPYKKGPDYIDAGWLSAAAGRLCYNLDPFLIGPKKVLSSFNSHFGNADCAVIEGNRGLYDGMDSAGTYSTAELAKLLKAPVILILDCTKVTRTTGAMVLGVRKFDAKVDLRAVVLNQIAGSRHEDLIREVIERHCGVPVLGAIPKLGSDMLAERHMGLTPFHEHPEVERVIAVASETAKKYIDLDGILEIARQSPTLKTPRQEKSGSRGRSLLTQGQVKPVIGVVRDSAFQFYYPENFEELEKRGAELLEISALTGDRLPEIDALYIGGGFPETNAIALARNATFRKSLKKAVEAGLPVYAECGGLMYLGKELLLDGKTYPMAGVFPLKFRLEKRPQAHGYTIVEVDRQNPFYAPGTILKGHEFHYSRVVESAGREGINFSFRMRRGQGIEKKLDGICYKNTLATYTHVHAYGAPEWAESLVRQALLYKTERKKSV
jgi:cobyrinic acid a,c-diamide synthase